VAVLSGQQPYELLVQRSMWGADGVVVLDLVDPEGGLLLPWEPGAHLDVVLPSGLVRQYSLCGDLDDRERYRIAVLREARSRGGSVEVHDTGLVGKRIEVRGPRNHFSLVEAPHYLFLGGGIGITPLLPMMQDAEQRGVPWRLVYGGRSRSTMAFLDQLGGYGADRCKIVTEDEQGYPDFDAILRQAPEETAVYCCGPTAMIDVVEKRCAEHLPRGALHVERFTVEPSSEASRAARQANNEVVEVELARTGVTVAVAPDESILEAVLAVVPEHLYSCQEGYCGTCEVRVLDGEPDHRDVVLTDEEKATGDKMIICVSRALSARLVLDL